MVKKIVPRSGILLLEVRGAGVAYGYEIGSDSLKGSFCDLAGVNGASIFA